ncbi:hypothetical protein [Chitinimonas sp.]|uniref:hypothetical protein n=1 Tax=Chitinimonas sp. TaxID=1934313 RepID=UPI0035B34353
MQDARSRLDSAPFDYLPCKDGKLLLRHLGKVVKTLSGRAASQFLLKAGRLDGQALQLLLARETGQFKFGNEKQRDGLPR